MCQIFISILIYLFYKNDYTIKITYPIKNILVGTGSFGSKVKNLPTNGGDMGSIPRSGSSPGEGNDDPLHYSCLRNPMNFEERGGLQFMGWQKSWI